MSEENIPNSDEKSLVEKFLEKKIILDNAKTHLEEATKEFNEIHDRLLKLLEDDEKKSSAFYEGLGSVTRVEGAAYASIEMGRAADVLEYLKSIGRDDMIKTKVEPATLSAYVRQCLKENEPVPPGVTFYKPKWLLFNKA